MAARADKIRGGKVEIQKEDLKIYKYTDFQNSRKTFQVINPIVFVSAGTDLSPDKWISEEVTEEREFVLKLEDDMVKDDPLQLTIKHEIKKEEDPETKGDHISANISVGKLKTASQFCCICKEKFETSVESFRKRVPLMCDSCYENSKRKPRSEWIARNYEWYSSCIICEIVFYNNLDFLVHDCTCANLFWCDYCSVCFDKKNDLIRHVSECCTVVSNNELTYLSSKHCRPSTANCGENLVSNEKSIKSKDTCLKQSSLYSKDKSDADRKKKLKCRYCKKKFTFVNLQSHLRTHTQVKKFICKQCNRGFTLSHHLKRHLRIHSGEKPFTCEYCRKSFSHSFHLQTHLRTHTGEKGPICKYCKKEFSSSSNLRRHLLTHTKEKPFICKYCNKGFTQSNDLKKHIRTHTGEKPYKCKYCEKSFNQSGSLNIHIRIHTKEKRYVCQHCNKKFARCDVLSAHLKKNICQSWD